MSDLIAEVNYRRRQLRGQRCGEQATLRNTYS